MKRLYLACCLFPLAFALLPFAALLPACKAPDSSATNHYTTLPGYQAPPVQTTREWAGPFVVEFAQVPAGRVLDALVAAGASSTNGLSWELPAGHAPNSEAATRLLKILATAPGGCILK